MHRSASAKNVRNVSIDGSQHSAATDSRYKSRTGHHRILVPFHNVNICSTVLHKNDFNRVKTASRCYTKEERQRHLDKFEEDQKRLQEESERRKNFLQYIDEIRNEKLKSSGEPFHMKDPAEDEKTLSRVFWAKHEQVMKIIYKNMKRKHFRWNNFINNLTGGRSEAGQSYNFGEKSPYGARCSNQ